MEKSMKNQSDQPVRVEEKLKALGLILPEKRKDKF
jgi:hypothetical protein